MRFERCEKSAYPNDCKSVEEVGADYIAHHEIVLTAASRNNCRSKFRKGCASSYDRQSN